VILPETPASGGVQVAERIRKELAAMSIPLENGGTHNITASIGVSELRDREKSSEFIRRADSNLYAAKAAGKNRVIFI
jgi:diguanylate cyclase (GGDEF)-like protein